MKRLRVNYFIPGQEIDGRPLFKYVLAADAPVNGRITVEISSLDPAGHPGAVPDGIQVIITENTEKALSGVLAILNSHHDKLKAVHALAE